MFVFLSAIRDPQSAIGIEGSSLWQAAFISFAIVLILLEIIRGWRLGVMRQLMRVAAVVAGYAAAYFGGDLLVPFLRWLRMPDIVISALAGAILAVTVYGSIASLGTLLFKRTSQQSSGTMRWVYGLSGALLGICFGAFFLWLILIGVRSAGSIAEAQVQARPKPAANQSSNRRFLSTPAPEESPSVANLKAESVIPLLARLKKSVEMGALGDLVKKTDAMPTGVYQTLNEAGIVLADPETARRFFSYPGTRALSEHPKIVALRDDPQIAEMIAQGRLLELMRHPRVIDAMNDPTLTEQVKGFDFKKALEYAGKKN